MNRSIEQIKGLLFPISLETAFMGDINKINSIKSLESTKKCISQVLSTILEKENNEEAMPIKMCEEIYKYIQAKVKETNLAEKEERFKKLQSEYPFIDISIELLDEKEIETFYKHRKTIESFLKTKATKRLKETYSKFSKINREAPKEALQDMLSFLEEDCKSITLEEAIYSLKKLASLSLTKSYLEGLKETEIQIESRLEILETEKTKKEQEEKQRKELEKRIILENEKRKKEVLEKEKREREEYLKPIDLKDGICLEFDKLLEDLSNISLAKENVLPVFLHIYSGEKGDIFDFIPKEKIKILFEKLKKYSQQEKRNPKIFIFTNKPPEVVNSWLRNLQIFAEENDAERYMEGGISKYGSYFCNMEGETIPMAKMDEKMYKKVSRIFVNTFFDSETEKLINEEEKDFLKVEFPKELGERAGLRVLDRIRRRFDARKDAVGVLGYNNKENIEFDIILASQIKAKERIMEYCNRKFIVRENKGINVRVSKIDEVLKALEEKNLAEIEK